MKRNATIKVWKNGPAPSLRQDENGAQFTLQKAMRLASTDTEQKREVKAAASFLMDGHSVDLSPEMVAQKPSILRSDDWRSSDPLPAPPVQNAGAAGIIRVCWQCPEKSRTMVGQMARMTDES